MGGGFDPKEWKRAYQRDYMRERRAGRPLRRTVKDWLDLAEEARALLRIAEEYERLARELEEK